VIACGSHSWLRGIGAGAVAGITISAGILYAGIQARPRPSRRLVMLASNPDQVHTEAR
jgi:hypothetical protein